VGIIDNILSSSLNAQVDLVWIDKQIGIGVFARADSPAGSIHILYTGHVSAKPCKASTKCRYDVEIQVAGKTYVWSLESSVGSVCVCVYAVG